MLMILNKIEVNADGYYDYYSNEGSWLICMYIKKMIENEKCWQMLIETAKNMVVW